MEEYNVAIIGAGVTGTAILYTLSKYTNVDKIVLIDKCSGIAQVQSHRKNNSQTLHMGDIESHYSLEKSKSVKKAAYYVKNYVDSHEGLHRNVPKMLLAVGKEEVSRLKEWWKPREELFPNMKIIEREEIAEHEPKLVEGRNHDQEILAVFTKKGYAVDYGALSKSFVDEAQKSGGKIKILVNTKITNLSKKGEEYIIKTKYEKIKSKVVIFATSGHSLYFAHKMGYGKNFILLPIAGSFFCGPKYLNGKVYTMQNPKLPFAAVHGDPDVKNKNTTRFGPIAKVLPMLERYRYASVIDFIKLFRFKLSAISSLITILLDPTYYRYVLWNMMYDLPYFGKYFFAKEIRKIIPSVKGSKLMYGRGIGGIRPQMVDIKTKSVKMGEAKLIGDNLIFNITPSPGASVCLDNARIDVKTIVKFLGEKANFDEEAFEKEHQ